jgi:hypothetical protein
MLHMPIRLDDHPFDWSSWVAEKADSVLGEACTLVDLLRQTNFELDEAGREEFARFLRAIIYDAANLSSFGHENMDFWSEQWVKLMFVEGHDRFLEFQNRIGDQARNDDPPLRWPLSFQEVFDVLDEAQRHLSQPGLERTQVRGSVLSAGRSLMGITLQDPRAIGDKLIDLVDDETVHGRVSWPDFIRSADFLIDQGREVLLEKAERAREPWV